MSFSINDLRVFTLVAHEKSVSNAAQVLGVAQQSVSERNRRLERRLGVELFVRRSHGMSPSPAGYRFLPYAQRILALAEEAAEAIGEVGVVRVGVQASVAVTVTPLVEAALGAAVKFDSMDEVGGVLSAVANGACDVGFGSFSTDDVRSDLVIERAFDDPVVCVGEPGHPLAERGQVRFADLPGWGAALNPRSSVARELAEGTLVELDVIDLPEWVVPIHVAYRESDRDRPLVTTLREAFEGSLAARSKPSSLSR